ncbi:MAG: hypothetical protein L0387_07660 [Acidobacteria bacterium]|nr:hypothetical protein [Acidobacteriota bacterium]MCI0621531.1 hypothetical protein [Acidobacteriota bacterium]MCI0725022.1 hypothetical protein [Acidobacteriota bacterium]
MRSNGRNYDLIIFDLDGTLIDSKLDLANSVNFTRRHMGLLSGLGFGNWLTP